jgi:hypothetical protein
MKSVSLRSAVAGGIAGALVAVGTTAFAATGGNFILGKINNEANQTTGLISTVGGPALRVTSSSTASNTTALDLVVPSGKPPLSVSSTTRVLRLNADQLDGIDSVRYVQGGAAKTGLQKTTGSTLFHRERLTVGATTRLLTVPGMGLVDVSCPDNGPQTRITFQSTLDDLEFGWDLTNPFQVITDYDELDNGAIFDVVLPGTWRFIFQAGIGGNGAPEKLVTMTGFVHADSETNNCHVQISAVLQTMP